MARYIDAERMPNDSFWEGLNDKEKAKVLQWLLQSPTADVEEVKHGEWDVNGEFHQCTECSNFAGYDYDYCPYCGAKMDRERK